MQQGHKEEGYVAVDVGKCGSIAVAVDVGYGEGECGELFSGGADSSSPPYSSS